MFKNEAPKSDESMLFYARMGRSLLLPVENSDTPDKRTVTAQPDKGLLYIVLDEMKIPHLKWKNRVTNVVDLDLMIFPDDTVFKQVQGNQDGKVYILKYKNDQEAQPEGGVYVFWLQDEDGDKDEDLAYKVDLELNYNSKKRLDPSGKHGEPPARPKKPEEPSTEDSVPTGETETPEPTTDEPAPLATSEPLSANSGESPEAIIANAYSSSICDSAVVQASANDKAISEAGGAPEGVENENNQNTSQRGKEKRPARSDKLESPKAKRNRPNDDEIQED